MTEKNCVPDVTSAEIAGCALKEACKARLLPDRTGPPGDGVCDAGDCGRPLNAAFLASATSTFRSWRTRKLSTGAVLTLGMMIETVQKRWPAISTTHARQIIEEADWPPGQCVIPR
jgi:hypothetical protein